jgi:hypothetical protein
MKKIAGTFMLLAGLGGCMQTDKSPFKSTYKQTPKGVPTQQQQPAPARLPPGPNLSKGGKPAVFTGPYGEPIVPGNNPRVGMSPGLAPAGYAYISGNNPKAGTDLVQAGYLNTENDPTMYAPGQSQIKQGSHGNKIGPPTAPYHEHTRGITPVPAVGPPGAVAAIGANPFRMPQQPNNMRTSVNFASPDGMRITWYGPNGWNEQPLFAPARYNFLQGGVYRLRLSSIVNRLEKVYYPTIEIIPAQETTATYLAHSSVPVTFTDEDFEQVDSGNFLVKVVYLPNLANQDLATVAGPNELISTRLEPGVDPIVEAQRRGTILMIVRLGNIDLNAPNSPAMDAPNPNMMPYPNFGGPPTGPMGPPPNVIPIPYPKQSMPDDKPPEEKKLIVPEEKKPLLPEDPKPPALGNKKPAILPNFSEQQ